VRRALPAGLAAAIRICASACSGTPPPAAERAPRAAGALALRAVPGCTTSVARAPQLSTVRTGRTQAHGEVAPFAVAVTPDSHDDFVSTAGAVLVFRNGASRLVPVGRVPLPDQSVGLGETITRDGQFLLVANARGGAAVLSTRIARTAR
jgi:hypothetical protein